MKRLIVASTTFVVLFGIWAHNRAYQRHEIQVLERLGAKEFVAPLQLRLWWDSLATCLHIHIPFDPHTRLFLGDTIPREWLEAAQITHPFTLGITNREAHLILVHPKYFTPAVVRHELYHAMVAYGHPSTLFYPPRCGMAGA